MVGIALAFVTVLLVVGLALSRADDGASDARRAIETSSPSGLCPSMVEFDERRYLGNAAEFDLSRGESLGLGIQPSCSPNDEDDDSGLDLPRDVEVSQIRGIDVRVAITPKEAGLVYVAPGRCGGFEDQRRFERCLRVPLEFEGIQYVETRLIEPVSLGEPLGSVARSGCCGLPSDEVSLTAIAGGATETAVADASDPSTIYVAIDECLVGEEVALRQCVGAE